MSERRRALADATKHSSDAFFDGPSSDGARVFDALLRVSVDAIVLTAGLEGHFVRVSDSFCELSGYERRDLIGRSPAEIGMVSVDATPRAQLRRDSTHLRFETTFRRKDGAVLRIEVSRVPLRDGYALCIIRDVSERHEMEQDLRRHAAEVETARDEAVRAMQATADFCAAMSHEVRTLMTTMVSANELLRATTLDGDQEEYVELLRSASTTLLAVVNDVLDLSKLDAGQVEIEQEDVDVRQLVDEVVALQALRADDQGVDVIATVDPQVPRIVRTDALRLRQVLLNLVSNAVTFTDEGAVVVRLAAVDVDTAEPMLRVEVIDSGIGIPLSDAERLFEPFQQGQNGRRYGGTGLGLTICRRLVSAMGGTIGVTSSSGSGSTFWFTLPMSPDAEPMPALRPLAGQRALVAYPHGAGLEALATLVAWWGAEVQTAKSTDEALALLGAGAVAPFDIVLADLRLGEAAGGIRLADAVRAGPMRLARVVVLAPRRARQEARAARSVDVALARPPRRRALFHALATGTQIAAPRVSPLRLASLRVLLAEDDPANRFLTSGLLVRAGHVVRVVANGADAVAAAFEEHFDLVLMDCNMPVLDGYEATAAIRAREGEGDHLPIVAMTASVQPGEVAEAYRSGMDAHLAKPFSSEALDQLLEHLALRLPIEPSALEQMSSLGDDMTHALRALFEGAATTTLGDVRAGVVEGDSSRVAAAAHRLRGAALTVGATVVADLARVLERRARNGEVPSPLELAELERAANEALRQLKA